MSETVLLQQNQGVRRLAKHKLYLMMITAKIISRFGDSVDSIAYSWMVYLLTGSELLMGTLYAINFVPGIAFSMFTGVLVDRWSKKKVVIVTNAGRGITVTVTALLYFIGDLQPWHLFIFTFINSTLECFSTPAEMSLVPRILPKELLLSGNSLTSSASRTAELAGLAAAGGLIAMLGISGAMLIDALSFLLAALLYVWIRIDRDRGQEDDNDAGLMQTEESPSYWSQFKTGLKFVKGHKLMMMTMLSAAFVNLCLTPKNVLEPVYVKQILHSGPYGLSLIGIALITGMIISGLWISQKGSAYRKSSLIVFGFLLLGVTYSLLYVPALLREYPLYAAAAFCFGMGFAISFINTPVSTYMMEVTPKAMLGRVGALSSTICTFAIPVGSLLAGWAGAFVGVHVLYLVFGLLMLIPGVYLWSQKGFMKI
ncbi:MFS transporter [Paenibacillus cellulositrophicus]|uniref:MFS transporter n=1 Tax=Paenibacillus cellulositrophicus TaxID=562959 RepID=UPI00203A80FA|nr:MFS transporter [Paenibacillus cellulositrophicus]MCM2997346.1 MFS transporter [Paenibacillus cellulositrophicus]